MTQQYWCHPTSSNGAGSLAAAGAHRRSANQTSAFTPMTGRHQGGSPATPTRPPMTPTRPPSGGVNATPTRRHSPTSVIDGPFGRHHRYASQASSSLQRSQPQSRPLANNAGVISSSSAAAAAASPNRKYKTEMCKNMLQQGYCRFGANCHYAHSEAERHATSVEDLMKDDKLLWPCSIMVSTGFCPYGHRCKNLHDPRVKSTQDESSVVILEHCTKAKKNGDTIPDRLYHHHVASIRQVNPLISPYIWEHCRPSSSGSGSSNDEWLDTYNLVCNAAGPGATSVYPDKKPMLLSPPRKRRTGSGGPPQARYADIVNKNAGPPQAAQEVLLEEAQKLCIVLQMRDMNDTHLDFTYAPIHCMNGQPCMVLQTRYFRLLDIATLEQPTVSVGEVISEVSAEVYRAGKLGASPETFVCAQEVAFDSKGKRACNLSIWFDAKIIACSTTKAKKVSKKEDPWHFDDKSGSLFCMPNNDEFEAAFPYTSPPYVFMQPIDDSEAGHALVKSILEHRIGTILSARYGFCFQGIHLPSKLDQLRLDFNRMSAGLDCWTWRKTSDVSHLTKNLEVRNQTAYAPQNRTDSATCDGQKKVDTISSLWTSFVTNIDAAPGSSSVASKKRLNVFRAIEKKASESSSLKANGTILPRIRLKSRNDVFSSIPQSEATWRELLLGEGGEGGPWKTTIESHLGKRECHLIQRCI